MVQSNEGELEINNEVIWGWNIISIEVANQSQCIDGLIISETTLT